MKRLFLLSVLVLSGFFAVSAQVVDEGKIERGVWNAYNEAKARQRAQEAAAAAQAKAQTASAAKTRQTVQGQQQQAENLRNSNTTQDLIQRNSVRPQSAGYFRANSRVPVKRVTYGAGAGKGNTVTEAKRSDATKSRTSTYNQGQWGTVGGDGNSYVASYNKNVRDFKAEAQQKMQQRAPRRPVQRKPSANSQTPSAAGKAYTATVSQPVAVPSSPETRQPKYQAGASKMKTCLVRRIRANVDNIEAFKAVSKYNEARLTDPQPGRNRTFARAIKRVDDKYDVWIMRVCVKK